MEFFQKAKVVRLLSHHDKYLLAEDDEESVCQDRNGSSRNARWTVEIVEGDQVLRLRSRYDRYLTATDVPFLFGVTGQKVLQTVPRKIDSSVQWEPIRDGFRVKLKTRYGNFLRANGGLPPWRNSITHDIPHRTSTQDWLLWHVDIMVEKDEPPPRLVSHGDAMSSKLSKLESIDSLPFSPPKADGRIIYFTVADDSGNFDDTSESTSFTFKGTSTLELAQHLKEETGLNDLIVCSRNPLNRNLCPLRLQLPPNNADMHVVVVKSSSQLAKGFTVTDNRMIDK